MVPAFNNACLLSGSMQMGVFPSSRKAVQRSGWNGAVARFRHDDVSPKYRWRALGHVVI
jgi:hypothetical protein